MIQNDTDAIDAAYLRALIRTQKPESVELEYKESLPGKSDKDKNDFRADVSAFANTRGGRIIYGVKAAVDGEGRKTGAPESVQPIQGTSADAAKLRLEELMADGIEPRLRAQVREIEVVGENGSGFVLVIDIPESEESPHAVKYGKSFRFHVRHSAGKRTLNVREIGSAFRNKESSEQRVERFRQERLALIEADETPVRLCLPHRIVLHLIPITSFLNNDRLDLARDDYLNVDFKPLFGGVSTCRHNLDGFLTATRVLGNEEVCLSYCQLFFHGAVETTVADIFDVNTEANGEPGVRRMLGPGYEGEIIERVDRYLKGLSRLNVTGPVVSLLSMLGCKGVTMAVEERLERRMTAMGRRQGVDRDSVIIPPVVFDDPKPDVPARMRPIFDAVWNAFGFPRSRNYREDGTWRGR